MTNDEIRQSEEAEERRDLADQKMREDYAAALATRITWLLRDIEALGFGDATGQLETPGAIVHRDRLGWIVTPANPPRLTTGRTIVMNATVTSLTARRRSATVEDALASIHAAAISDYLTAALGRDWDTMRIIRRRAEQLDAKHGGDLVAQLDALRSQPAA